MSFLQPAKSANPVESSSKDWNHYPDLPLKYLLIRDKCSLALGTFYHQRHHRYFECNYGNQRMPWDRWFGTFHDGSDEGTAETQAR